MTCRFGIGGVVERIDEGVADDRRRGVEGDPNMARLIT